jgi:hypothetical protein
MFNFKKITALGTSALMVGMTLGVAAAASFPSPFQNQAASNVAVVTGSGSGVDDSVAAGDISAYLASRVSGSGGTVSGEAYKLERSSDLFNLGNLATDVVVTAVNDEHLSTLLTDGTYRDDDNDEFNYEQKVDLSEDLILSAFQDDEYSTEPIVGIKLTSGATVLTYTLDFTKDPTFTDAKMGSTDLHFLGKDYFVLSVSATDTMTLLDSAETTTVGEGSTATLTAGGKTYTVTPSIFGTDNVKLSINGEVTPSLSKGDTYKLSDGSYVGIKDLVIQNYQGGQKLAEFSIGAGKLVLEDGQDVELNEETVTGLGVAVTNSTNKLDKIVLTWKTEDTEFITPTTELVMPGFNAIKLSMGGFVWPTEEVTRVENDGSDSVKLNVPIKDGTANINLLFGSAGVLTGIGKSSTNKLVTTNDSVAGFIYNDSANDKYFVASWNSTAEAESYYLQVSSISSVSGSTDNKTTIRNVVTGQSVCTDKKGGETCTVGNVLLNINEVFAQTGNKYVNISSSSASVSFHELYTKEGLKFYLPFSEQDDINSTTKGGINFTSSGPIGHDNASWYLFAEGQDKDENLGKQGFNLTVTKNSDNKLHISALAIGGYSDLRVGDTDKYLFYTKSDVVSKVEHDQGPTQQKATITYSGNQAYGEVYLGAPGASISGVSASDLMFKDNEKSSWQNRNVVLVGGSCINSATAEVLGVSSGTCDAAFKTATGVGDGEYMIKSVGNAFTSGKIALVIAGFNRADTQAAATKLVNDPTAVDTTAGFEYRGKTGVTGSLAFTQVA